MSLFSREPRLYKRVCPSVGPSVHWSIRWSVRRMVPCYFRKTKIAVFEVGKTSNDQQQQKLQQGQG